MKWILGTLILLIVLYALVCIAYYKYQENIIFHPEKIEASFSYDYPIPYEEFNVQTPTKASLNGVICQQENPKGVIIYFHGNASHVFELGWMAKQMYDLGYDILIYDYRSYGKSTGKLTEKTLFSDAKLMYNQLTEKYHYNPKNIIIYGRSIGSGLAVKLASEVEAKMLILETPYASLLDLGKHYTPYLPYKWLMRFPLESEKYIKNAKMPTYILHGTADKIVPYASGKRLGEVSPNLAEFITIEGANHNDLYDYPIYGEKIRAIF
ncbi:MAG: pimeloyl-ACP methyl ester carboxylesterase, partial [Bacteroidia bacterium]